MVKSYFSAAPRWKKTGQPYSRKQAIAKAFNDIEHGGESVIRKHYVGDQVWIVTKRVRQRRYGTSRARWEAGIESSRCISLLTFFEKEADSDYRIDNPFDQHPGGWTHERKAEFQCEEEYSCPLEFLDMVPNIPMGGKKWREKVRQWHAQYETPQEACHENTDCPA